MKYLLTMFAIIAMLTSCDGPQLTEDECRQNIDYSDETAGEIACGAAAYLHDMFGINFW